MINIYPISTNISTTTASNTLNHSEGTMGCKKKKMCLQFYKACISITTNK